MRGSCTATRESPHAPTKTKHGHEEATKYLERGSKELYEIECLQRLKGPGTRRELMRNSLMVQRLSLGSFTAGGSASIPGRGTKIQQTKWCSPKNKNDFFFFIMKEQMRSIRKSMSLMLTRKFQIDWFSIPDLSKAEAAKRLGIKTSVWCRLALGTPFWACH